MPDNFDYHWLESSLENTMREAQKQLTSELLYIVATKQGYIIVDKLPQDEPVYYRVNVDKSTTLIVTDQATKQMRELPLYPASEPNLPTTDLALEDDKQS
jgi:hypothetical protein